MAQNADTVAVEVEARLNTASVKAAEVQFDQSMNRIAGSAGKAEAALRRMFDPAGYRQERLAQALRGTGDAAASIEKPMLNAATRTRQLGIQIGQKAALIIVRRFDEVHHIVTLLGHLVLVRVGAIKSRRWDRAGAGGRLCQRRCQRSGKKRRGYTEFQKHETSFFLD